MWLDNLKDLKKANNLTIKQIAERANLPERTLNRIFSGETANPYVDTIHRIAVVFNASLDDIFADTKVVVANESLAEVKENMNEVEAKNEVIVAQNDMLEAKVNALTMEIELLKKELQHKDELLALHNYYNKLNISKV